MKKITRKEAIIWASGQYLTEELPNDYDKWNDKKLEKFVYDKAWFVFEDYDGEQVMEFIAGLADSFLSKIKGATI